MHDCAVYNESNALFIGFFFLDIAHFIIEEYIYGLFEVNRYKHIKTIISCRILYIYIYIYIITCVIYSVKIVMGYFSCIQIVYNTKKETNVVTLNSVKRYHI